jgi:hypothetical protein
MTQDELITPQQLYDALVPTLPPYSVTRVIATKLRALYDNDPQSPPWRINDLLDALHRDQVVN